MHSVEDIGTAVNDLTMHRLKWCKAASPPLMEVSRLLQASRQLHLAAAKAAIRLPEGEARDYLLGLRAALARAEQSYIRILMGAPH